MTIPELEAVLKMLGRDVGSLRAACTSDTHYLEVLQHLVRIITEEQNGNHN